ncbi:uncharacterized protein LOC62_06G008493 [Vanrija pseudolonga]|uniref:NAD(P)-binding domain-containing protein n=1 Tax=Vanrija pseudolonga TaxID=143232 RepID=A0AAF1BLE8_9TREE|nr:hypothetical protein LOC62_06G008493 [Vanrija pseudolonga]
MTTATATTPAPRVLLVGATSRTGLFAVPHLLKKGWHIIASVRSEARAAEVKKLAEATAAGTLETYVLDLTSLKTPADARAVLDATKPTYVVWPAGANEDADAETIHAIDFVAAQAFMRATVADTNVTKYMHLSYLQNRRRHAPWWNAEDGKISDYFNTEVIGIFHKARVVSDGLFAALVAQRRKTDPAFQGILFRPSVLVDTEPTGKFRIVRAAATGSVTRADTADVLVRLLARDDVHGYVDLENGEAGADEEIQKAVAEGFDAIEGEFDSTEALLAEYGLN